MRAVWHLIRSAHLFLVLVGLFALGTLSLCLSYVDLGNWSVFVALTIAAAKVGLVALFYMELVKRSPTVRFAAAAGPLFVALLVTFVLADVATR